MKEKSKKEKIFRVQTISKSKWQKLIENKSLPIHIELKNKLFQYLSNGNKIVRRILSIGMNSVMKKLELNEDIIVCICRDCPLNFVDSLMDVCLVKNIKVACLPGSSKELGKVLSIKRVCCFSLPSQSTLSSLPSIVALYSEFNDFEKALVDGIRETLEELVDNNNDNDRNNNNNNNNSNNNSSVQSKTGKNIQKKLVKI